MAETFVQVNIPSTLGKKMKTFENVDGGGNTVQSEAVVTVDAVTGLEIKLATEATVKSNLETINSLVTIKYDYIDLTYVGNNINTVIYKAGGAGGVVVSTLTLAYDANNNIISLTKT